jgi:aconitate hydratase
MSATLHVGGHRVSISPLATLDVGGDISSLPHSLKVLLENLIRHRDDVSVTHDDIEALARWDPAERSTRELSFSPARILLQDFTGVPAIVDLAAMRDAVVELGGDPATINPRLPSELVIDHSIVADVAGSRDAFSINGQIEYQRNRERYQFLRWGQSALDNLLVVPPNTGICHQVNLEHLARVVFVNDKGHAYPDTLVGTDSHTPMINGLGVLGWGVGGIEAEAAMLGQPISMLTPQVVGFRLSGALPEGATATDLVLTVTELLRRHGVVGKFVEFYGPGVSAVSLENRATIGNMSPEYGSTCSMFPIDDETLRYLRFTGRAPDQVALVEAYAKQQGLWHEPTAAPRYTEVLELELGTVVPSLAGPSRPQDRVALDRAKICFREALGEFFAQREVDKPPHQLGVPDQELPIHVHEATPEDASAQSFPASDPPAAMAGVTGVGAPDDDPPIDHEDGCNAEPPAVARSGAVEVRLADQAVVTLDHGAVVIAAITSCTNTSNPSVMIAAGLLAKAAVERGLTRKPWVKTSLAPGSRVVMDYYERAGLLPYLEALGFYLVGYGCTTCIGNSGPLDPAISEAIERADLSVAAVLSGNRNFEGRINPDVRMNYLASPPLVVAYALAGTMDFDPYREPLGLGHDGPVFLRDIWPSSAEVAKVVREALRSEMFVEGYAAVLEGDARWRALPVPTGQLFEWDPDSTYVRRPTLFAGMTREPAPLQDIIGARALALLGDSVTTDHISPAGVIATDSPAGQWLRAHGVEPIEFNSYGSRRGNHEVMVRGTFANIRLRNLLAPGTEGGVTRHLPSGELMSIYDAAMRYASDEIPLVVLAGKEYGSGSSRDWAAKGTAMLGVRAVLAESYERIHRSNLIGLGVLPLELPASVAALGLSGEEVFDVRGVAGCEGEGLIGATLEVEADRRRFEVRVRIDTLLEASYYRHGGILHYVLRQLAGGANYAT